MGCSKSSSKREVYSNTILTQETRKALNRQCQFTPKTTKKKKKKEEEPKKQKQTNKQKNPPNITRRKEIIKIQAKRNEKELQETIVKMNKTKRWFLQKIKLTNLQPDSSRKKEKNQINKLRNEKGEVTTANAEIQRIIRGYYEQLYVNKMDNLEEMDRKVQSSKTEPGRNRNFEQPNYKL